MTARQAEPLPECLGCSRPTRRITYAANGGLCTDCSTGLAQARRGRYVPRGTR
jgi:hypothetical protein